MSDQGTWRKVDPPRGWHQHLGPKRVDGGQAGYGHGHEHNCDQHDHITPNQCHQHEGDLRRWMVQP